MTLTAVRPILPDGPDVSNVSCPYTWRAMRTNIDLDEALIREAMEVTGLATKKAAVEEGLRRLIAAARRKQAFDDMAGLGWEGDLDEIRRTRSF